MAKANAEKPETKPKNSIIPKTPMIADLRNNIQNFFNVHLSEMIF